MADALRASARIVLGLIFMGASVYKILSPGAFAHEIYNYHLLPCWAINPAAIALPWLQLLSGLALVANRLAFGAALIVTAMMVTFQVAVASALIRGLNISCGCFKSGGAPATWLSFARDSVILMLALIVFASMWRQRRPVISRISFPR